MRNALIFVFILIFQIKAFGQTDQENKLINALLEYKTASEYKDSLKFKENTIKLNTAIENSLKNESILAYEKFKQITDSLNVKFVVQKSENNKLLLFTMSDNFFHWNYIVSNAKIILKDNKWNEYYTEIHNLDMNEFLLIEQRDDLVFSCNYASVFEEKGKSFKHKKVFGNKTKLTLCGFTKTQNLNEHFSLLTKKISFDYKNKIISYGSCVDAITGKETIGKAKYSNGKFKIKDCDERNNYE